MRDLAINPLPNLCVISISETGDTYELLSDSPPSSELPAHLAIHETLLQFRPAHVCVLHSHPTALVALSLRYPEPESLLALLFRAHAEMSLLRGEIYALPFLAPGTEALAEATGHAFRKHSGVVWSRHGMIASGSDLHQALDLLELCDKAAQISLLSGAPPPVRNANLTHPKKQSLRGFPAPDGLETFYDVKSFDSPLPWEEFKHLPRIPVSLVLDNLRSAFNVGSIFRLADAVRAKEIITCGYTAHPPHPKLEQTALGATAFVPWRAVSQTTTALEELKANGVQLVALETAANAHPYDHFPFRAPLALVLGNEALGVSQSALQACEAVIALPVFGFKNSINVAAAAAVVLYDLVRRYRWL